MSEKEVVDYGSIVRPEQAIRYDGKDYTLRRANSGPLAEYRDAQLGSIRYNADGSKQLVNANSLSFKLLSICLYDKSDNLMQIPLLKAWPDEVISDLFKRAKKICGLEVASNNVDRGRTQKMFVTGSPPVSIDALREWLVTQDPESAAPLLELLAPTAEEEAKN